MRQHTFKTQNTAYYKQEKWTILRKTLTCVFWIFNSHCSPLHVNRLRDSRRKFRDKLFNYVPLAVALNVSCMSWHSEGHRLLMRHLPSMGEHLNDWAILFQASVTWVFWEKEKSASLSQAKNSYALTETMWLLFSSVGYREERGAAEWDYWRICT